MMLLLLVIIHTILQNDQVCDEPLLICEAEQPLVLRDQICLRRYLNLVEMLEMYWMMVHLNEIEILERHSAAFPGLMNVVL